MKTTNFKSLFNNNEMIIEENWENFSEHDHQTWEILFKRQIEILKNRATDEIIEGLEKLKISESKIPKFEQLNEILEQETGFEIIPVSGLIPPKLFFEFLSKKKFPSTCFIRKREELDYLE
jgi:phenylalanine-4-hydroxylase